MSRGGTATGGRWKPTEQGIFDLMPELRDLDFFSEDKMESTLWDDLKSMDAAE